MDSLREEFLNIGNFGVKGILSYDWSEIKENLIKTFGRNFNIKGTTALDEELFNKAYGGAVGEVVDEILKKNISGDLPNEDSIHNTIATKLTIFNSPKIKADELVKENYLVNEVSMTSNNFNNSYSTEYNIETQNTTGTHMNKMLRPIDNIILGQKEKEINRRLKNITNTNSREYLWLKSQQDDLQKHKQRKGFNKYYWDYGGAFFDWLFEGANIPYTRLNLPIFSGFARALGNNIKYERYKEERKNYYRQWATRNTSRIPIPENLLEEIVNEEVLIHELIDNIVYFCVPISGKHEERTLPQPMEKALDASKFNADIFTAKTISRKLKEIYSGRITQRLYVKGYTKTYISPEEFTKMMQNSWDGLVTKD